MKMTLGQAAKETGKSKATISKAINSGRLSAHRNNNGSYDIDPSELFRVYPANRQVNGKETPKNEQQETPNEQVRLQEQVNGLTEQIKQANETIGDLRHRLDDSERERREKDRAFTALLTDQRKRGFWARLFGSKG